MSKKFAYIIWSGTLQKSVIPVSTIAKGEVKENGKVTAKWHGQLYEAEIVKLGMYVANTEPVFILSFCYTFMSQMITSLY